MNGAVEAANKNVTKILRKMIDNYKDWYEQLPYALLGYRTTARTSTVATPYLLVYGTEVVIPAKAEIPSLRIMQEAEFDDVECIHKSYEQLSLKDEKRMIVVCHGQLYQQRMTLAFNKNVITRVFQIGQLVLKRIFPNQEEYKGKFAPNWQGPYIVRKVLSGGAADNNNRPSEEVTSRNSSAKECTKEASSHHERNMILHSDVLSTFRYF
ncbi:uncharacterized protein LOC132639444 [Lycium barbarum]|uniref:uncharacterized protein LOC132639444 n=1 Tax=Lycium barbarum TaxID=112863 RepID=UPI00293E2E64|nr:uncharacterized protein LOC132639444 [Lycium barbarum]